MAQVQESFEEQRELMPATDPAYEAWFRRQVEAGLRDAREGRVLSAEEAEAEMDAFFKELENNPDAV
jgi:predicted transcriptional regulator